MVGNQLTNYISNIKNAALASKEMVTFPYSKLKVAMTDVLEREGFVKNLTKKGKKVIKTVDIKIVYEGGKAKLKGIEAVSRPSKRIYLGFAEITPVKSGHGFTIVSTSKGVMTDKDARKQKVGGEILFRVW